MCVWVCACVSVCLCVSATVYECKLKLVRLSRMANFFMLSDWHLENLERRQLPSLQKEIFIKFQTTFLNVFDHCEINRHNEIMNDSILASRIIILKVYHFIKFIRNLGLQRPKHLETKELHSLILRNFSIEKQKIGYFSSNFVGKLPKKAKN